MWLCLSDSFLSVVHQHCGPKQLLVRGRKEGDIEQVWPYAKVKRYPDHDYLFAAVLPRETVALAVADRVRAIRYPKFKPTVKDAARHRIYLEVWAMLANLQEEEA